MASEELVQGDGEGLLSHDVSQAMENISIICGDVLGVVSPHLPGEILRAVLVNLVNFNRFSLVFTQF